MNKVAVDACPAIKDEAKCMAYESGMCNYNYAPVEPTINKDECTHRFEFNTQRKVVDGCQTAKSASECNAQSKFCIWNECATDFGNNLFPCSSQDKAYCIQSNGQFNPGECSADKNATIKCVPALESDAKDRKALLSCLVLNSEDRCANAEQCKWEGEKTICHDTPGWTAFRGGVACSIFSQRYCVDGGVKKQFLKYASSQFNNPSDNCCACGKKIKEEIEQPTIPVNPNTIYNKCTVQKADIGNW